MSKKPKTKKPTTRVVQPDYRQLYAELCNLLTVSADPQTGRMSAADEVRRLQADLHNAKIACEAQSEVAAMHHDHAEDRAQALSVERQRIQVLRGALTGMMASRDRTEWQTIELRLQQCQPAS